MDNPEKAAAECIIAECSVPLTADDDNANYNMTRALMLFDGLLIRPNETVSFFDVAGPCGKADGYKVSVVIGGLDYGGGICRTATVLYGAALRAGFEVVERSSHSEPVSYAPMGLDATVSYDDSETIDLKVRNPYDFPVSIRTDVVENALVCQIRGIRPNWFDRIEISSWQTSPTSASAERRYIKGPDVVRVDALPSSSYPDFEQ